MSHSPQPPPAGWTLPEAAAALFPDEWAAAHFPDDGAAARERPGIQPQPSPWAEVPSDAMRSVVAAVMAGSPAPPGMEALIAACRDHEVEVARRISAARTRRAERRAALPGLLAARLARGDFLARGISGTDPLKSEEVPTLAWGTAEIALGWETGTWHEGNRPQNRWQAPPPAPGTVRLAGGVTLLAVRVFPAPPREVVAAPAARDVAQETPTPITSTGVAGRPTSLHLIQPEHARRLARGEAHEKVSKEAEHLATWLAAQHPKAPRMTTKTIENAIRDTHRRPPKSPPE